jgi:precorrin-6A/cobalt-precorrin-6A reductase
MKNKVWLIGGTSESVAIAKVLTTNKILFAVSVVTPTAQALYPIGTQVFIGCMSQAKMEFFCQQEKIKAIIDASHPYAVVVSHQAIAVAEQLNLPYLRYERSNHQISHLNQANLLITELDSFDALLAGNYLQKQRVLLTIGCKALPQFQSCQSQCTLYARVLPTIESLTIAKIAGFTSDRLIALRPPLSIALEKALWQQWNISLVITKASGKAGGEDIKRQVAADLNIPLIIITRPKVSYPQQTSTLPEVLTFCRLATNH